MIARFVPAALVLAPLALVACTIERAPRNPEPPPPAAAPAPTPTVATLTNICPPIGYWRFAGPAGAQEIRVKAHPSEPGKFNVDYKGATLGAGTATQAGNNFSVDLGQATGGMYNCQMTPDCLKMSCGFTGQQPTVFTKAE